MPWALLTLMPGYGPPFAANLAMNHVRFVILFISTAFLGMVGAADGLANAAASGEIDAAAAKAELFDTILALVARSRP